MAGPPNLAQYRLPATDELAGEEFLLEFAGSDTLSMSFPQPGLVRARWRDGHGGLGPYEAVAVRPGVFLIILEVHEPATDGLAVVVDRLGPVLAVVQHRLPCPGRRDGTVVKNVYLPGRLAGTEAEPPSPTLDLLGRWDRYRYSDTNLYEHIYLSTDRFCSHNLATENTPGRADCHPVDHWRLGDGLYLIAWRERGSGAAMTVVEDLQMLRITGSVLHPASEEHSATVPIGGLIEVVRGATTAAERGMRGEARGWEPGDPISGGNRQPPRVNELT